MKFLSDTRDKSKEFENFTDNCVNVFIQGEVMSEYKP